jgi:membrane-bound lytic murein transglycosylase MltF
MRRKLVVWLCAAIALTWAWAVSAQSEVPRGGSELMERGEIRRGDLDEIRQRGFIRVLVTHNKTNFFVTSGQPRGFEYELLKEYEKALAKRTKDRFKMFFLPVAFDELIPYLNEGRGDIAAAGLTVTSERSRQVAFGDSYLRQVDEIVVTHKVAPDLTTLDDLAGRTVYVRKGSSYVEHLEALNADLRRRGLLPVTVEVAPQYLETEDILELVNAGIMEITVVDEHIAELWSGVLTDLVLRHDLEVHSGGQIAWAVRKDNPQLLADVNTFVGGHKKGTLLGNIFFKRYFQNTRWVRKPTAEEQQRLAELRGLFEKYADRYGFDWLMIAALAFQESGFDQSVRSSVGAVGVMQVLPSTAASIDIPDITDMENNIHAGVKYLDWLRTHFFNEAEIDPAVKVDFTLASYNAGPGRVTQLRKQAPSQGYDANQWFANVERVALQRVGWETVRYVANINKYYFAFKLSAAALEVRREEMDSLKKPGGQ